MREIKFRGKRIDNGEWCFGSVIHRIKGVEIYDGIFTWDVDHNTVGQFTGLLDKNGKEIYEGDIVGREVSGIRSVTHIIEYSDCGLSAKCLIPGASFFFNISKVLERYYVIGNIHEDPNLLTDKI